MQLGLDEGGAGFLILQSNLLVGLYYCELLFRAVRQAVKLPILLVEFDDVRPAEDDQVRSFRN